VITIQKTILKLQDIFLTYQAENGEVEALKNINFTVDTGELISIIGPSGCGKSTLLSIISGLTQATKGSILIAGEVIQGLSPKIGYMLQKDSLLEWRTIKSNVLLGLEIRNMLTKANIDYTETLLKTYGLWDFKDKYPSQLSGGMRQRAALIRTLAPKPEILLLDESFSALDYQTRLKVADDIFTILKSEQKTALIVTHDISEGISMADRVLLLSKRPGTIKKEITTTFTSSLGEQMTPLKRREDKRFREYFNDIWGELDKHV
jgi:NitT/TauT family transport system ATP-binding protein